MKPNQVWEIGDLLLSKELIPSETQEQQISNYLANTNLPKPINYLELADIAGKLINDNIKNKDRIIKFLRNSFNDYWIQTASGVLYRPEGQLDSVIHDKGMSSEQSFDGNFVGLDRYIQEEDEIALKLLTGLENLDEIKERFQFLAGRDNLYLLRVNIKPKQDVYKVAGFNVYSDGSVFICSKHFVGWDFSLGVLCSESKDNKRRGEDLTLDTIRGPERIY